ncbi:hypothetical protein [Nonomuraea angiospora]
MTAPQQITVPAQDGVPADQQRKAPKLALRQAVKQPSKEKPINSREYGLGHLPLQHHQLVPNTKLSTSLSRSVRDSSPRNDKVVVIVRYAKRRNTIGHHAVRAPSGSARIRITSTTCMDEYSAPAAPRL